MWLLEIFKLKMRLKLYLFYPDPLCPYKSMKHVSTLIIKYINYLTTLFFREHLKQLTAIWISRLL